MKKMSQVLDDQKNGSGGSAEPRRPCRCVDGRGIVHSLSSEDGGDLPLLAAADKAREFEAAYK